MPAQSAIGHGDLQGARDAATVTIVVPTALRRFNGGAAAIEVPATTVGEALHAAACRHPRLRPQLFAADGRLRRFINVFVNSADIRHRHAEETALREGDVMTILPAIAGG